MAARSQPGNDPLRADLLARMVALPDPGRGQRVLQSVGSIAVIVLLAIVCVYARDEGVAGNPLFQHVLPLRQAPVVATFCVIFLLGLNFGDGSILPLAWCGCLLMMPVPIALSYGQAESEQAVEEIAGYYLVYQQRPFVLLVGSCCLGVMHACLVPQPRLRRGIALAFLYGLLLNPAQTHYLTGRAEVWLSGAITCTGFTVGFGLCELGVRWHASAAPGPLQKERHSPPRHAPPPSPPTSPAPAPAGPLEGAPRAEGEIHPAVQSTRCSTRGRCARRRRRWRGRRRCRRASSSTRCARTRRRGRCCVASSFLRRRGRSTNRSGSGAPRGKAARNTARCRQRPCSRRVSSAGRCR